MVIKVAKNDAQKNPKNKTIKKKYPKKTQNTQKKPKSKSNKENPATLKSKSSLFTMEVVKEKTEMYKCYIPYINLLALISTCTRSLNLVSRVDTPPTLSK